MPTFIIMKRVNINSQDECQTLLLKMRDEGAVKFDIHKGMWMVPKPKKEGMRFLLM